MNNGLIPSKRVKVFCIIKKGWGPGIQKEGWALVRNRHFSFFEP